MTKFYVDAEGNYLGGFQNSEPPVGSIEVPSPPEYGLDTWNGNSWIPYTKTAEENKAIASQLLSATDWVNQPDVRDVNNSPHLINANEFDAYRLKIRKIAVNPIAGNLEWESPPTEQWSN